MITLIDITESILYIRKKSKQKATAERILVQLKKNEQYEDLKLCTVEKEILLRPRCYAAMIAILFLLMFLVRQQKNKLLLKGKRRKHRHQRN